MWFSQHDEDSASDRDYEPDYDLMWKDEEVMKEDAV